VPCPLTVTYKAERWSSSYSGRICFV